jgi:endo-1,4-beta-xylanase
VPLLRDRVTDLVTHYRGRIRLWDVMNEANAARNFPDNGVGDWVRQVGPAKAVETALGWARAVGKGTDNVLIYNDFKPGTRTPRCWPV